jgi:hypothetical protein
MTFDPPRRNTEERDDNLKNVQKLALDPIRKNTEESDDIYDTLQS